MFLTLRHVHLECLSPAGQGSKKFEDVLSTDLLGSTKHLPQLATLIKSQTYLYPRLHSSVHLLLKDMFLGDQKSIVKKYQNLNETVLEATIFDEEALA